MNIYQASHTYNMRHEGFNARTGMPSAEKTTGAMAELIKKAELSEMPHDGNFQRLDQVVGAIGWLAPTSATLFNQYIVDNSQQRKFAKTLEFALAVLEERSPETWQHILHHTALTMLYYERQNGITNGNAANTQELLTLLVGALGHDFGKIGIDPKLLHKPTRVDPKRFEEVLTQYKKLVPEYPEKLHDIMFLEEANKGSIIFSNPGSTTSTPSPVIHNIGADLHRSENCSTSTEERQQHQIIWNRIEDKVKTHIPSNSWFSDVEQQALTMCERGTVTPDEKRIIESHDAMSEAFFAQAPLPPDLAEVKNIVNMDRFRKKAGAPQTAPPLAEIIHATDIFEALTANRSYRRSYSPKEAVTLMEAMGKDGIVNSVIVANMQRNRTIDIYATGAKLQKDPPEMLGSQHSVPPPTWLERVFGFDPLKIFSSSWTNTVSSQPANTPLPRRTELK